MSYPNLGTIGDVIGAIGSGLANSGLGAGPEALGEVLSQAGRGATGVGSASDAGNGSLADEAGHIAAQMFGSEAAVAAGVAYLSSSVEAALFVGGLLTVSPALGIVTLAGAAFAAGYLGSLAGEALYGLAKSAYNSYEEAQHAASPSYSSGRRRSGGERSLTR